MPLREPRMELDRRDIQGLFGWSGISLPSICRFVQSIPESSHVEINGLFVYNRGQVELEDTERRDRECWMLSVWSANVDDKDATCIYQIPIPVRIRLNA